MSKSFLIEGLHIYINLLFLLFTFQTYLLTSLHQLFGNKVDIKELEKRYQNLSMFAMAWPFNRNLKSFFRSQGFILTILGNKEKKKKKEEEKLKLRRLKL